MKFVQGQRKWQDPDDNWIQRHSLGVVLVVLMVLQTSFAVWSGAFVFSRMQPLGEGVPTFGWQFWGWWGWEYNVSLVADTFGVLLIVLLSKWLYEQDSAESTGG